MAPMGTGALLLAGAGLPRHPVVVHGGDGHYLLLQPVVVAEAPVQQHQHHEVCLVENIAQVSLT